LQSNGEHRKIPDLKKLLADRSIILVSNRGPVEFEQDAAGNLETRRGGGGLVTAMTAISKEAKATWISAAMNDIERSLAHDDASVCLPDDSSSCLIKLVDIPEDIYNRYYNIISNPLLWFIHHYIWNLAYDPSISTGIHDAWHNGYVAANKLFAQAAVKESRKHRNPIIMLQDYHLFVAARYIRELSQEPFLFHFTHIPWPEPDYMRILPESMRTELLEGMLSNDMVGFQSRHYADNFLLCCETLLQCHVDWKAKTVTLHGHVVHVQTYPISIDHESLVEAGTSDKVLEYEAKFMHDNEGLSLIVRTDRSDPSKNIVRGFRAFEVLLNKHPELKEKVKFLALLYPTRENIKAYNDYLDSIIATVNEINDRYKTDTWSPIHLRLEDNYLESIAALKCYDVLLVNPIYDGMNLVAKEGPVLNNKNGVLILSENAGATSELGNTSLVVSPFDIEGTAAAIYDALTMADYEKRARASTLREIVQRNNSVKWLYYQIKDIIRLEKKKVLDGI